MILDEETSVSQLVAMMKSDVLLLIASGRLPQSVGSLSECGSYLDQNFIGIWEQADEVFRFRSIAEHHRALWNSAAPIVDAWLQVGCHRL